MVKADTRIVDVIRQMQEQRKQDRQIFYDIYSQQEKRQDPEKKDTGLFFFRGEKKAPFAVVCAGGGFYYVGSVHESLPHALELSRQGYNGFALVYRTRTADAAWQDLARAIRFIFDHAAELGVDTEGYSRSYLDWVVVLGGVPTMLSLSMGHLLRSEGHARPASIGMMFGGILNVVLDPVLIFGLRLDVTGAAMATALSNLSSLVFFVIMYRRLGDQISVSLLPKYFTLRFVKPVFSVGLASALATGLDNLSNMVMVRLASGYGDIPVAAYGIVKRIDQFPLNVSMGLCQGFMPLVGYNYAAKNYKRMRAVSFFSWKTAVVLSACFVACFATLALGILHLFIPEAQTSALGAQFLRIACLAVPFTAVNFLISYTLQAMGKGTQSAILTFSRQGLLNIPLLIIMDVTIGLYGMIWTQLVVELVMLPVSLGMYMHTWRKLK